MRQNENLINCLFESNNNFSAICWINFDFGFFSSFAKTFQKEHWSENLEVSLQLSSHSSRKSKYFGCRFDKNKDEESDRKFRVFGHSLPWATSVLIGEVAHIFIFRWEKHKACPLLHLARRTQKCNLQTNLMGE